MHIAFLNPQGNFDAADSYLTEHPDFGGQLVYVKELAQALARKGVRVDIVTRLIDDPDWPEFSEPVDYYPEYQDLLRILRVPCGDDPAFLPKESLWPRLPGLVEQLLTMYGDRRPDYLTGHYADGGYCAVLMQQATGVGFTFTGHSLGAQKLDKSGMNPANAAELEQRFNFSNRIAAERLARFFAASVELMQVLARACGHDHLGKFAADDLTTFKRDMAELTGVAYGGVA